MNPNVTTKEEILAKCREIAQSQGLKAVTIRNVAKELDVAVGSLYNYFPSKDDLMLETVTSCWHNVFHFEGAAFDRKDFLSVLRYFDSSLEKGMKTYPGFFSLHAFSFADNEKGKGEERMQEVFTHMKAMMKATLDDDPKVRPDAFKDLDENKFIDMVFLTVVHARFAGFADENTFVTMISRVIY
jgi:TetR/AcrR family transcriptional regulator, cholesterol catabolism regulator